MKKTIALIIALVMAFTISVLPINAKMTPNSTYPVNIMTDTWTTPILTYQGRYNTSNTISNINNASKVVAFYIPSQDVGGITVTVTDIDNVSRTYTSTDFVLYPSLLKDTSENTYPVTIIYTDIVPIKVVFNVSTIPDFTASGGNTGTWETNIQGNAYLSTSQLFNLNSVTQALLDEAFNSGYSEARNDYGLYLDGTFWGYNFSPDWYSAEFMFDFAKDTFFDLGFFEGQEHANNSNLAILSFIPSIIGAIGSFFLTIASFEFLGVSILGVLIVMATIGFVLIALKFIRG
jgi:hypothetical protein